MLCYETQGQWLYGKIKSKILTGFEILNIFIVTYKIYEKT
jgi:hypothetical protein